MASQQADVLWNLAQHRPRQQEEARRRAIDYVQQYGALEGREYPRECQDLYHGVAYFAHVQASWQQPVCEPQAGAALGTSLRCHYQFDKYSEMHCTATNLALDIRKFEEEDVLVPRETNNTGPTGLFEEHPRPGLKGELLGDCKLSGVSGGANRWQESDFGKGGQRWLFNSFQSTLGDAQQPHCLAWVEHPVYFLNDKYDSFNLWHALEDVSHAFEAYVLKGWGAEAQVVVMDGGTVASVLGPPYLPVWRKVFSPLRPPVLLRQMVAEARARAGGNLPPQAALCFRDAFFSVHGGISALSRSGSGPTPCVNSTFIRAMSHFITDGLGVTGVRPASRDASQVGLAGMRVVWGLRKNRADRQDEILDLLRRELPKQGIEVVALDFGKLPLEEQIRQVRSADLLAGYHGAALTLSTFMDYPAAMIEVEQEWLCTCNGNCARWKGLDYRLIKVQDVPDSSMPGVLATRVLEEAVAALRVQAYAASFCTVHGE
ncbi:EGF domain-specific O-linked N-acetylglucosamine transferase isoform A [Chlorella sorokiniana]|uniref:EGF domain-specific O-linked N-acetylglucosamine transferase isoform A n=1 Tax=Chlorella sorokiniana TaxID=3076 RepID=A0A2P6U4S7_CHLSO|nr:EGF domain-specific O-linked N-acetylglucosamine transferase isoform A [Chlorella sorokiniana]|eukprot:PRW61307.1 EGF domain-specific O-linked N-acetylglucosamine transferase isoform A [Chlorella sorokiniana]